MDVYSEIVKRIIKQQETIIGPVAIEQAEHIPGLDVNWAKQQVSIKGDGAKVIDDLVGQYKELFGKISVEVCKEAAEQLVTKLNSDNLKVPKTLS